VAVEPISESRPVSTFQHLLRPVEPHPYAPSDPVKLDERCEEIFLIMATSLARRLASLPADRLIEALGATAREASITEVAGAIFTGIGHDPQVEDLTFENVQAWARKMTLFAIASQEGGIDLGTGDLSEIALGWCTYGGDHISHYGINAGVPKTLVSRLIQWDAEVMFKDEPELRAALQDVLAVPISPELLRPSSTNAVTQLTEEVLGPYELQDFFLYYFTRFGFGPRRIARMALHAFDGRYEISEIRRWLLVFLQRFFANQFKREAFAARGLAHASGRVVRSMACRGRVNPSYHLGVAQPSQLPSLLQARGSSS
jgi:NH3-dependent NAD+ synthetase